MSIEPLTPHDARLYSPLALAFLGDSVYEQFVREKLLHEANRPARQLHDAAVARVRAEYQAMAADTILGLLTEEEMDIYKRGRNASGISVPRHASVADYRKATGFECLFGYLQLCGRRSRLEELFAAVWTAGESSVSQTAVGMQTAALEKDEQPEE